MQTGAKVALGCLAGCAVIGVLGVIAVVGLGVFGYRKVAPELQEAGVSLTELGTHDGASGAAARIRDRIVPGMDLEGWRMVRALNMVAVQAIQLERTAGGVACTVAAIPAPDEATRAQMERQFHEGVLQVQVDQGFDSTTRSMDGQTLVAVEVPGKGTATALDRTWLSPDGTRTSSRSLFLACPGGRYGMFVSCDTHGADADGGGTADLARRVVGCAPTMHAPEAVPAPLEPLPPEPVPETPAHAVSPKRPLAPKKPLAPLKPMAP